MKITLLETDLLNGKRNAPSKCPIALAINRAFNGEATTHVYGGVMLLKTKEHSYRAETPNNITQFIREFDLGNNPELITFELNCKEL